MKIRSSKALYTVLSVVLILALLINAAFTLAETPSKEEETTEEIGELVFNKKAVPIGDDGKTFQIQLEAYIKGAPTAQTVIHPADIVLLLDQSSSMGRNKSLIDGKEVLSQEAMKAAVDKFIDNINEIYDKDNGDHRIAIAQFNKNDDTHTKVLQNWTQVNEAGATNLKSTIDGLIDGEDMNGNSNYTGTYINRGMKRVEELFDPEDQYKYTDNNNTLGRSKFLIVFSDGSPGVNVFEVPVADEAIKTAQKLKSDGVTIYTVGMFQGANADELYATEHYKTEWKFATVCEKDGADGDSWSENSSTLKDESDANHSRAVEQPANNRFFNLLSSNYPAAESLYLTRDNTRITSDTSTQRDSGYDTFYIKGTLPERSKAGDFYIPAQKGNELEKIYQNLSDRIATANTNIQLFGNSTIKDLVSSYFTLSDKFEDPNEIIVETAECTSYEMVGEEGAKKKEFTWATPVNYKDDPLLKDKIKVSIINATEDPHIKDIADFEGEDSNLVTADKKDISVTGFDFNYYCVTALDDEESGKILACGRKLIIRFNIEIIDGFYGGNNVPTNNEKWSGIYDDKGNLRVNFQKPLVNIPLPEDDIEFKLLNHPVICKGNKVLIEEICDTGVDYDPEDERFSFIKRKVEIFDGDDNLIYTDGGDGYLVFPETQTVAKGKLIVTFEVQPLDEDNTEEPVKSVVRESTDTVSVFVMKPTVHVNLKDVNRCYGDGAYDFGTDAVNDITVTWADEYGHSLDADGKAHGIDEGKKEEYMGEPLFTADDIYLDYSSTEFTNGDPIAKKDFKVSATPFFKDEVIKNILAGEYGEDKVDAEFAKLLESGEEHVRAEKWSDVEFKTTCDTCGSGKTDKIYTTDGTYKVHVKTGELTINNVGGESNETFVYTILKDGKPYTKVTVKGGGKDGVAAKISELPVGEYTVVADSSWSWRYKSEFKDNKDEVTLSKNNLSDSVTCTNTADQDKKWSGAVAALKSNKYKEGVK